MLSNNNKKIFSSILLSLSILIVAKSFENKIISDKTNDIETTNYTYIENDEDINSNDNIDTKIIENEVLDTEINQEEQNIFTEEELINMMTDGTVIIRQQGHYPSYVYCIKVSQGVKGTDGIVYFVPNGYLMYEELKATNDEDNQVVYVRTHTYRAVEKGQSRSKIKIIK